MSKPITNIGWQVTDYCTGGCSYCHAKNWGGPEPRDIKDYIRVTEKLIKHYTSIGRTIHWNFDGGDPLEIFEFPKVLKMCKEADGEIILNTAGGKLWLDWWAWEPYVDHLNLTFHYWQNPNLIKFVIQNFKAKNKTFNVSVPIRHDYFDADIERADAIASELGIGINKTPLYVDGQQWAGLHKYTDEQLEVFFGKKVVVEKIEEREMTFVQRFEKVANSSPVYSGWLCNVGIDKLNIGATGWTSGSDCNNDPMGNIFDEGINEIKLPNGPQMCKMQSCMSDADQLITKFEPCNSPSQG